MGKHFEQKIPYEICGVKGYFVVLEGLKIGWLSRDLANIQTSTVINVLAICFELQNQFKTSIKQKLNDPLDLFGLNLFIEDYLGKSKTFSQTGIT